MTDAIRRAQRAELIINDDLFKEAIQTLRDQALAEFKAAKPGKADDLLTARSLYDATERFINIFANIIRDGQYAKIKEDEAKLKKKPPPPGHPANFTGLVS